MPTIKTRFAWRPFLLSLAKIGIPVAFQNVLTTTAGMVDTMMVAPLGELSVGALGLCAQFSSLMFSGSWGFVGGGVLFFSQYWGSKEEDGIERSYGLMLTCMMAVTVLFSLFALLAPQLVMQIYTDKASIQQIGIQYLQIAGFAYILQVLSTAISALLRATEQVRIPMIASAASVSANLFLNWVFIYGNLGMPALGIQGAALATTIAAAINVLMLYFLAWRQKYPFLFRLRRHFRWSMPQIKAFMAKVFPILCNEVLIAVGFMGINITLGRQSEQVIAALAVFRTLEGLIIAFFMGFSSAASVLVGKCVGAGELDEAFQRGKRLVYLCSGVIFVVDCALLALSSVILQAMSLHDESLQIGQTLLIIYTIASVIRMGNWIQNDTYRASGDAVTGTVLEIVFMYLMVLPCVLLTGFVFKAPYWVIFICCYIDEPVRYVLMQLQLYSGQWIRPVTDLGRAALPAFRAKCKGGYSIFFHKKQKEE